MRLLGFFLVFISSTLFAQRKADLGVRLNANQFNRVQIEFRDPVGENYYGRYGVSLGFQSAYPTRDIFDANDSVVTTRQEDIFGNHFDFRFGFERRVSYDWLSFHADIIGGYASITQRRWNYFHVLDSSGTDWDFTYDSPYTTVDEMAIAVNSVVSGGLALGMSFNFAVTENFILNFTGNYTGMMRFAVSQKESNDLFNEFEFQESSTFDLYPSAGIGLRFILSSAPDEELPPSESPAP